MTKPKYIIVAGINGAGKSTMYEIDPGMFADTKRINADEMLRAQGGDWRKTSDTYKAMHTAVRLMHEYLDTGQSFHMETTLEGNGNAQERLIKRAHENGFEVSLLYVALPTAEMAIERVNQRVAKGGHGVPDDVVRRRFSQSLSNLPKIARIVDNVRVFTNEDDSTLVFERVGETKVKNEMADVQYLPNDLPSQKQWDRHQKVQNLRRRGLER